jgi:hypothetical protein
MKWLFSPTVLRETTHNSSLFRVAPLSPNWDT